MAKNEPLYKLSDIKRIYNEFNTKTALRIQKAGKWSMVPLNGLGIPRIDGTKASIVKIRDYMSFIDYLEDNQRIL